MSVEEIYREVILDHYRNPRHRGSLTAADAHAEGNNPLCGDEVLIDVALDDGRIADVAVSGSGCAISQASASMMTEAILGKTTEEMRAAHSAGMARYMETREAHVLGQRLELEGLHRSGRRFPCELAIVEETNIVHGFYPVGLTISLLYINDLFDGIQTAQHPADLLL